MIEPDDGEYVLAMSGATNEGTLYQRDDRPSPASSARWFSLSDPDDVYTFANLIQDYRTLIRMKATEWYDTGN